MKIQMKKKKESRGWVVEVPAGGRNFIPGTVADKTAYPLPQQSQLHLELNSTECMSCLVCVAAAH